MQKISIPNKNQKTWFWDHFSGPQNKNFFYPIFSIYAATVASYKKLEKFD